ncbi:GNAT family N-acetyltransferase [Streptomyces sp. TRM66268-LWL]|uniref:GNAT family N-acetyltransferase n=1 Tax=Streptomyces polyasparticus TaxID=2767826 RepID=A0ABR7SMG9_9ACTN|nr:GNAT family N-acetyltransferase [Streptomyces polyasparticus]MBC9716685.1 GNAT family N-acetyltransferase [Streptomyces polyasparticus]
MTDVRLGVDATASAPALVLRPWHEDDLEPLIEAFRDAEMRRWLLSSIENAADARSWLESQDRGWASGSRLSFAVRESSGGSGVPGRLLGNVVLKRDDSGKSAEVGYWTSAAARGRGVASRALEALTAWSFETFAADGLERLDLLHQVGNRASCRVAEKTGYGFDRILPAEPPWPEDGHLHVRRHR